MTVVLPGTGMGNTKEAMVQLERNTSMSSQAGSCVYGSGAQKLSRGLMTM